MQICRLGGECGNGSQEQCYQVKLSTISQIYQVVKRASFAGKGASHEYADEGKVSFLKVWGGAANRPITHM